MAWTAKEIKNLALQEMNHEAIDNWDDTLNTDIPIINSQYALAMQVELVKYAWSFADTYAKLTTASIPADSGYQKYKYSVALPENVLGNISAYTSKNLTTLARYEIIGTTLYTDLEELYIKYTGLVSESVLPPEFVDWFAVFFACRLNSYLNGDMQRQQYLESQDTFLFRVAKNVDSKRNKHEHLMGNPLLWIRGNMGGGVI